MKIISGKQATPRRIFLYGVHAVGKSTFASESPKPIFVNIEDGLADIDCDKTEQCKSYDETYNALFWIYNEQHSYRTVVIDTVDWLERLIFAEICLKENKETINDIGYGRGGSKATTKWEKILNLLENIRRRRGMNIILLGHARLETVKQPDGADYKRYCPDLWSNTNGDGASSMLQEWCDEVLFAHFKTYTKTEGKGFNERAQAIGGKERAIRTCDSATAMAKNRIGLPPEIPMDWKFYADCVKANYAERMKKPEPVMIEHEPEIAPPGKVDISGMVVDGSSKIKPPSPEIEEMKEVFSNP